MILNSRGRRHVTILHEDTSNQSWMTGVPESPISLPPPLPPRPSTPCPLTPLLSSCPCNSPVIPVTSTLDCLSHLPTCFSQPIPAPSTEQATWPLTAQVTSLPPVPPEHCSSKPCTANNSMSRTHLLVAPLHAERQRKQQAQRVHLANLHRPRPRRTVPLSLGITLSSTGFLLFLLLLETNIEDG